LEFSTTLTARATFALNDIVQADWAMARVGCTFAGHEMVRPRRIGRIRAGTNAVRNRW
jgi:hypothetical protein